MSCNLEIMLTEPNDQEGQAHSTWGTGPPQPGDDSAALSPTKS
jgi:hypothetical protein